MNSSQLPYADREEIVPSYLIFDAMFDTLPRTNDEESVDINAALAKLEGRYAKSEVGSSEETFWPKPDVREQWQAILARYERRKAVGLYYGRCSKYLDEESMQEDHGLVLATQLLIKEEERVRFLREQATAEYALAMQQRKSRRRGS